MASKFPTPGKHHLAGARDLGGIGGDCRLMPEIVKGLLYRGKIAGLIVDDGDHRSPFVLGNRRAIRRSRQQAARSAREKALNKDSIL